ncbi:MAG: hypothetical protein EBY81_05430 [Verrucomicrobia bacterium]|nr:hypothetical protein [Verrucomicrobiota bacterium]
MKALTAYVEQKNRWNALFKGEQFEVQSAAGRRRVAQSLDADLSPENLTCDGEVRGVELRKKQDYLNQCVTELIRLDPAVKESFYEYYTGE